MNIAIVGYGKMGHEIETVAKDEELNVISTVDPNSTDAKFGQINMESLKNVDICIDFSMPDVVIGNIEKISKFGVNIVEGTTGWYNDLDKVKKIVNDSSIGFIYSSNFSIGVNIFFRILEKTCEMIDKIEEYDILCYELHHKRKMDSPSGTAKTIGDIILKNIDRKSKIVYNKLDRKIMPDELHIGSVRGGYIPGTHVVDFDSEADTIELKHTARSRKGFAIGAVLAAKWLKDKKGFFNIDDFMKNLLTGG
jgi:4-hydroxy-tetrahydrodipicolinate reductase